MMTSGAVLCGWGAEVSDDGVVLFQESEVDAQRVVGVGCAAVDDVMLQQGTVEEDGNTIKTMGWRRRYRSRYVL